MNHFIVAQKRTVTVTMHSQVSEKWLARPTPGFVPMPGEIIIPIDVFLGLSTFLTFTDYRSLIRAFWPDGDEDELIKKKLWEMSCHNLEATFYNGKHLEIEYNLDATRKEQHRVLFKVECLLPIFGGVQPLGLDEFVNILELEKFIRDNVNLESCSNYRCVCCPYHLGLDFEEFPLVIMEPTLIECEKSHFHHYCIEHVISWLVNYLHPLILLLECKELFDEQIAEQYAFFPSCIPFFQSGSRATPQFLLESALNIDTSFCGIDYDVMIVD
ncbi:repeat element 35 protein [Diadegma fenestrale ichnovirus]|nr:repeat element 35 protein [Diadegma fenestrale ichnovirus]